MKKCLALLMTSILLFSCCAFADTGISSDDVWGLVSEAYTYAFPLVLTNATKTLSTNTETPTSKRAPVNQFIHADKLADAQAKMVVTPNVDTIYTQAWLELSEEPLMYVMPETDRFFNVQVLDAWTNTVTVLEEAGTYAFTLPGWEGTLPEGTVRVNVPTATVWLISRIVLSGEQDIPNVQAIQREMHLLPLSAFEQGGETDAPKGTYNPENDYVPVQKVLSMNPKVFFNTANQLMLTNPPAAEDAKVLEKFAAIHVGPGMEFDLSVLSGDIASRWTEMLQQMRRTLLSQSVQYTVQLGQWRYFDAPIGDFGTEYAYRAMVALAGLGANTVDVAIYPKTDNDNTGAVLNGEKNYLMHFETLPPTAEGGFWSVTAYGSDDFLIENPINRYCVNDRSAFRLNEDGSLDILLSCEQPEDTSNWLPVSDGVFHLYMRIYLPDMTALQTWQAPVIHVIE